MSTTGEILARAESDTEHPCRGWQSLIAKLGHYQPVWLLALVAVLGFGSGHPTFGALMAVLFVVALLRVGRTIIIGVPFLHPSHIGRPVMATVAPFHSSQNPGVYHTCSNCTEGNNIERQNRKPETGGGHLCEHCRRLHSQVGC